MYILINIYSVILILNLTGFFVCFFDIVNMLAFLVVKCRVEPVLSEIL